MNLRCTACGRMSYSASPEVVIRNGTRCGDCGGELATLQYESDDRHDDGGGDERISGA